MNARMEYRLDADDKTLIERAAELRGVKVSAFNRAAAIEKARDIVREADTVVFSQEAARDLLESLGKPFSPNAALRKALGRGTKLGI